MLCLFLCWCFVALRLDLLENWSRWCVGCSVCSVQRPARERELLEGESWAYEMMR